MVSICVLCCDLHGAEDAQVDKLCEALALSQARGSDPGPSKVQNEKLGQLMCAFCADTIESAIVRKQELLSTEQRIRKLESLLEKSKGQLETGIGEYREQMKEVDEIMKDSDKRVNYIGVYFEEMGIKGELKGAIDLRNDMLSVVRELHDFGTSLEMRRSPEERLKSTDHPHQPPPPEEVPGAPEPENMDESSDQDETLEIERDATRESDDKVVASSRNDGIRSCCVLLQRVAVPRAGGGKIRALAAEEENGATGSEEDVVRLESTPSQINYDCESDDFDQAVDGTSEEDGEYLERVHESGRRVGQDVKNRRAFKRNRKRRRGQRGKYLRWLVGKSNYVECLFRRKICPNSHSLEAHMRKHTRERPFWCRDCGREFTQLGNLQQHHLTHTGEKPHRCEFCRKRFAQSSNLSSHVMAHHLGEKPHGCHICGKAFGQKAGLTAHLVVHTRGKD